MKLVKLLPLFAAVMPLAISAQQLKKEITVERDVVPEQREATRIGFTPRISLRPVALKQLSFSETGVTSRVPASITVLDPAAYADSIYISPYRGYASVGFMPMYNAAFSAGYRIVDTNRTRLGAWLQYDGTAYRHDWDALLIGDGEICGTVPSITPTYFRRNTATAAISLAQRFATRSELDVDVDYTFARYNYARPYGWRRYNQNVNRLNTSALWTSGINDLTYSIGAGFSRFAFVKSLPFEFANSIYDMDVDVLKPVRENKIDVNGALRADFDDNSMAQLSVDFSSLSANRSSVYIPYTFDPITGNTENARLLNGGSFSTWLLRLTPRYRYTSGVVTIDLGVKVDLTHHAGKAFHIAPDVTIGLNPSQKFAVSIKAGGGEVQNSVASIYDVTPYILPIYAYSNSHIPFTLDASVTVGPFSGAYLELFGGYAKANNWMMPSFQSMTPIVGMDVKGWHAGAALGYRYGAKFDMRASVETAAHSDGDNVYYLWRDRASVVVDASVKYSPITPLDVTLGYDLRANRKVESVNYGSLSNLKAGATWRFNPRLSVFLKGENLLNHSYTLIGDVPAQGITGLVGVAYKF